MSRSGGLAAGGAVAVLATSAVLLAWREGSPLVPRDGGVTAGGSAPLFLILLVAAFAAYVVGLLRVRAGAPVGTVLALAVVIQLAPLAAPLLLSTDAWTYWAYGWTATQGDSPYDEPPSSDPANPALGSMGADWRDTTSVYGPVFTLASQPVARLAGSDPDRAAWAFKALAALAALAATLLAARQSRRPALAAAFVGWNPVLAVHAAGGGHNDAWMGALLLAALALQRGGHPATAGLAWAAAILVKWLPVPLLGLTLLSPATARRARLATAAAASLAALATIATWRFGSSWLHAAAPLAENARRTTSFALPARLEQLGLPEQAALVVAGTVLVAGFAWLARDALHGRARLAAGACLVLATTPYLAVWYLGWAVPLAGADDDDRTARVACLALCAYLLPQTVPL